MHIRISHVYFRTKYHLAFFYLTTLHRFEKAKIFFYWSVAEWRSDTWFCWCSFLLSYLFCRLLIYISLAFFDETDCKIVELLEIIGCIENLSPFET